MRSIWVRRGVLAIALVSAWGAEVWRSDAALADRFRFVNWGGFYTGAELGGAWTDMRFNYENANYFNSVGPAVLGSGFEGNPEGVIAGFVGGYNYQSGPWILGAEVTVGASSADQQRASPIFPATDVYTTQLNWLATITGRFGYAWDRWMLYAKGGWAGGDVGVSLTDQAGTWASENQWANGWTVGGGLDYMIHKQVSLGVVYDYASLDIDNKSITCNSCPGLVSPLVGADVKVQAVMARLTFHE
jgi:outer membrane immunogenic protein